MYYCHWVKGMEKGPSLTAKLKLLKHKETEDVELLKSDKNAIKAIRKYSKLYAFPTVSMLLIVFGIAGLFIAQAAVPYVEAGRQFMNMVPEIEQFSETGEMVLHMERDPLGRPSWDYVEIPDLITNSVCYVTWDVQVGWVIHPPTGPLDVPVDAYVMDEINFTLFSEGSADYGYVSKAYEQIGQMYAIIPFNGTYYLVFDNSREEMAASDYTFKTVNYNIRAYIPEHTEWVEENPEDAPKLEDTIPYPFYGMIVVGCLGVGWWGILIYRAKKLGEL